MYGRKVFGIDTQYPLGPCQARSEYRPPAESQVSYWDRLLAGSLLGARLLARAHTKWLRWLFAAVVVLLAVQMIWSGVRGAV